MVIGCLTNNLENVINMKKKILVVEDDDLNMRLIVDLLEAHGFETFQSKDGCKLIELARLKQPDLIIMDIMLPGITGFELIKSLKADEYLNGIPVLVVTALALSREKEIIKESGCDEYISKPISILNFLNTVTHFINEPQRNQ